MVRYTVRRPTATNNVILLSFAATIFTGCSIPLTDDSEEQLECSEDSHLHKGHCYRYFARQWQRQFFSADQLCRRLHGHLASIHNADEQMFINSIVDENESYWIGLSDTDSMHSDCREGLFCWTDGTMFHADTAYHVWREAEPRNTRHRDCVIGHQQYGWSMAVSGCALTVVPFVCKRRACGQGFYWNDSQCLPLLQRDYGRTELMHFVVLVLCVCLLVASLMTACKLLASTTV